MAYGMSRPPALVVFLVRTWSASCSLINTANTAEQTMNEIKIQCRECGQCGLIYFAIERLHFECPVCCFPLGELLPEEVFTDLWTRRPEG